MHRHGMDLGDVKKLLGHSSIAQMQKHARMVASELAKKSAGLLGKLNNQVKETQ